MLGPNITGETNNMLGYGDLSSQDNTGALQKKLFIVKNKVQVGAGYMETNFYESFNATNSNSIYGSSVTVQPNCLNIQYLIRY